MLGRVIEHMGIPTVIEHVEKRSTKNPPTPTPNMEEMGDAASWTENVKCNIGKTAWGRRRAEKSGNNSNLI